MFGIVWTEIVALVAVGVLAGLGVGWGAAKLIARTSTATGGVDLPVELVGEDAWSALVLILVVAPLAAVPAALAYRQSAMEASRS